MKIVSNLPTRLREAMAIRGKKAKDISTATGISEANISCYVNGKYIPKRNNLHLIAKYLIVNELWLYGYDCEMDRFDTTNEDFKNQIVTLLDNMNEVELKKTLQFIKDYIIEEDT